MVIAALAVLACGFLFMFSFAVGVAPALAVSSGISGKVIAASDGAPQLTVTAPHMRTGVDEAMKASAEIHGTVTDIATKAPVEGVQVCLRGGESTPCEATDAKGEYAFSLLKAGTYELALYPQRANEERHLNYLEQEYGAALNPQADAVRVATDETVTVDDPIEAGGTITGTTTDARTGKGVADLPCAELLSAPHPRTALYCARSASESGKYTIAELPPGPYRVRFSQGLPAYDFAQYYPDMDAESESEVVNVGSGATVQKVDASLIPNSYPEAGAVAGRATAASDGKPVEGIEVCAFEAGKVDTQRGECATTDAGGEYLLEGLGNGEYDIAFAAPPHGKPEYALQYYGGATDPAGAAPVTVLDGSITPKIDASLSEAGAIAGVVDGGSPSVPVAGASVCASEASPRVEACVSSGADGSYEIAGLAPGSYTVSFEDAGAGYRPQWYEGASTLAAAKPVTVEAGVTTTGIDAALISTIHPGDGEIAGTVTDAADGTPIDGIEVCAYPLEEFEGEGELEHVFGECSTSGPHGEYSLTSLAPGAYEVEFSSPLDGSLDYVRQYYDEATSIAGAQVVNVSAGRVDGGIDARMHEGGRIAGLVKSAKTGAPVADTLVCALAGSGSEERLSLCAPSGEDGSYALPGLAAGGYRVVFLPLSSEYAIQFYDEAETPATARLVHVSVGSSTGGIDARLRAAASVSGTVTEAASGRPMANVQICAFDAAGEIYECANSEPDGSYTIGGLPEGYWRVGFNAGRGHYVQYWNDQPTLALANSLLLAEGENAPGIDAAIHSPGEPPPGPPSIGPVGPGPAPGGSVSGFKSGSTPVTTASTKLTFRHGKWLVHLTCSGAPCSGTVRLTESVRVRRKVGHRMLWRHVLVTLGSASYKLTAGSSEQVALRLTHEGVRRLAGARRHPVRTVLSVTPSGGKAVERTLLAG